MCNIKRIGKFILFSLGAGIIELGTIMIVELWLDYWIAYGIGLGVSVIFNFTMNWKWNFKWKGQYWRMLLALLFYVWFAPLSIWITQLWDSWISVGLMMLANLGLEYLWYRWVVFKCRGRRGSRGEK